MYSQRGATDPVFNMPVGEYASKNPSSAVAYRLTVSTGQILLSENTYRAVQESIAAKPLEPVKVKGLILFGTGLSL